MIAIVIPYYKINFFRQTLESLKEQTDKRFNVYIGNDNSPDDPLPIINEFKDILNINYKCFNTNLGKASLTKQWERCIAMIEDEEWFMLPGDDDTFERNVIEAFYKNEDIINKNNINVVKFATHIIDKKDKVTSKKYSHPRFEKSTDAFFRKFLGDSRSSICEYVFKTSEYKKYKFEAYPLGWYSDTMAILKWSNFDEIYTINDAIVNFRYSKFNISGQKDRNVFKKNLATFLFFRDLLFLNLIKFSNQQKYYIFKYTILYGFLTLKSKLYDA